MEAEPSASEPSTTQTENTARVSGNGDESLKLKLLKADFPGLVKAILWVRANKNSLRGDIFEPTCLELRTDKFIKFMKCLRQKDSSEWTEEERSEVAFTCEEPSTVTALIRELKTKRKLWPINVVSL